MDEERKARLEKMVATKRFKLAMETDEKKKSKIDLGDRGKRAKNGFDFRIYFGLRLEFKNFKEWVPLAL